MGIKVKHQGQQGIHRHQTSPRCRNATDGSRLKVQHSMHRYTAHYMTSSIKPEVHNISPEQDRATAMGDPQMQIGPVVPEIWAQLDRHTDRQTN